MVHDHRAADDSSADDGWEIVDEEHGVHALEQWVRCEALVLADDKLAEHMAAHSRPLKWNLERHVRVAMAGHLVRDVVVRLPYSYEAASWMIRMRARCCEEQAWRLRRELSSALTLAVVSTHESLALQRLVSIAQMPTAGDLARSHASTVRKLGMPVRTNGFFNATGWAVLGSCLTQHVCWNRGPWYHVGYGPLDWETSPRESAARPSRRQERRELRAHNALRSRQCDEAHDDVCCPRAVRSTRRGKLQRRSRQTDRRAKQLEQEMWHTGSCGCDDTPIAWLCGIEVAV